MAYGSRLCSNTSARNRAISAAVRDAGIGVSLARDDATGRGSTEAAGLHGTGAALYPVSPPGSALQLGTRTRSPVLAPRVSARARTRHPRSRARSNQVSYAQCTLADPAQQPNMAHCAPRHSAPGNEGQPGHSSHEKPCSSGHRARVQVPLLASFVAQKFRRLRNLISLTRLSGGQFDPDWPGNDVVARETAGGRDIALRSLAWYEPPDSRLRAHALTVLDPTKEISICRSLGFSPWQ